MASPPEGVGVDVTALGVVGAVIAAVSGAIYQLSKRKPEASEILVNVSMKLTEQQQALLEDRDRRLAALETHHDETERKLGVMQDVVEELKDALERVERERDEALRRADAAEARAIAAEEEVTRLRDRVASLEEEVERLRAA
jgi:chromosome segregation ATPase